jgi:hypothetical protein
MRGVEAVKPVLSRLGMVPVPEAVAIPYIRRQVEGGVFTPTPDAQVAAGAMLDELLRWSGALRSLRDPARA